MEFGLSKGQIEGKEYLVIFIAEYLDFPLYKNVKY
jgi:hypothetical protein